MTSTRSERQKTRLDILHAERDLLVVNKPAGLLTIPSAPGRADHEDTLLGRVKEYAKHKRGRQAYAGMLHRLDRGTSGALAVALSPAAHRAGRLMFKSHEFDRTYLAIVDGIPEYRRRHDRSAGGVGVSRRSPRCHLGDRAAGGVHALPRAGSLRLARGPGGAGTSRPAASTRSGFTWRRSVTR